MPTPRANIAQGTVFSISSNGTTYYPIQLLNSVNTPTLSAQALETTDLSSSAQTFIKGLVDSGEISANFRYDTDADVYPMVRTNLNAYGAAASLHFRLSLAGLTTPETYSGTGFFTAFNVTNETNAVRTGSMTFKVSGAVTVA